VKILRQALDKIPAGDVMAKVPRKIKPEAGEAQSRIDSPRGDIAYYVLSDGSEKAYRVRIRTPSFPHMQMLPLITRGSMIPDLLAILGAMDFVLADVDR
jgi:NADH:ubiquinone oxidoreductase subunit D